MKKKIIIGICSLVLIILLGLLSFVTTFGIWDGAIPSANFKIRVLDKQKVPVRGAKLSIFRKHGFIGNKKSISYDFPIQEFTRESQPISNDEGIIEMSHISEGLEIGGGIFALFWIFPITFGDPEFVVHVEAPNGKERYIEYSDLYENCDNKPTILNRKNNPVFCEYELVLK